jgi:hypothetical protein
MAVALLSTAVHLLHDGSAGLYRVGVAPGLQVQRARPAPAPAAQLAPQRVRGVVA